MSVAAGSGKRTSAYEASLGQFDGILPVCSTYFRKAAAFRFSEGSKLLHRLCAFCTRGVSPASFSCALVQKLIKIVFVEFYRLIEILFFEFLIGHFGAPQLTLVPSPLFGHFGRSITSPRLLRMAAVESKITTDNSAPIYLPHALMTVVRSYATPLSSAGRQAYLAVAHCASRATWPRHGRSGLPGETNWNWR